MAMDAKVSLMNEMERALAAHITTNDAQTVLSLLADTLQCYNLEKIDAAGAAPDDMLDAYCSALSVEGRSPKTIERYRYIMGRFSQSAAAPPARSPCTICANTWRMKRPAGSVTAPWKDTDRYFPLTSDGSTVKA